MAPSAAAIWSVQSALPTQLTCRALRIQSVAVNSISLIGMISLAVSSAASPDVPVRLGVDDGGSYHHFTLNRDGWEFPAYFKALDDLGARFVSVHFWPVTNRGEQNTPSTQHALQVLDRAMREHGLTYSLNVELSNWLARLEITPGVDEFARPGGAHRWDLRMDWLSSVLPPAQPGPPALLAVTYDECEHMVLSNNKFVNSPKNTFDQPYLVNTHGLPLTVAHDRLVAEATRLRQEHYAGRVTLQTEQVWPDLFHIFARAGWTVTPKLLKESISSVVMSIAMGSAIQYRDVGARLWVSPDLWNRGAYPGHSPEAMRSALMFGYWLGAENLYVENLDFHQWSPRHPQASPEGSLIRWSSAETCEFTAHGKVYRAFAKEYLPAHPRAIDWRDYDPRVAIIRLPDGGWGQFTPPQGEVESRNRLLGNRDMPLDEPASEWLYVWPILTHGAARPGAICSNNPMIYPKAIESFFAPIDSVAVFDHHVQAPLLQNIDCMIVCGHALSPETFAAVRERVARGAVCIIASRLYRAHAGGTLPGDWLVVDSFKDPRITEKLAPFLGPPDVARFRFRQHVVEFQRGADADSITVRVTDRR